MAFTSPTTQLHLNGVMGVPYTFVAKTAFIRLPIPDETVIAAPFCVNVTMEADMNVVALVPAAPKAD